MVAEAVPVMPGKGSTLQDIVVGEGQVIVTWASVAVSHELTNQIAIARKLYLPKEDCGLAPG